MANTSAPFGLAVARSQGAYLAGEAKHYYVPSSNASAIYIGDLVVKTGTSNSSDILGHKAGSLSAVAKASNSGAVTGVVVGILPNGTSYNSGPLPASTEAVLLVIDDPKTKFNIECNGTLAAADIGLNANITASTTGSAYTGISNATLDLSSKASTATLQLKILGLADYENNELGASAVVEVMINNSTEAPASAGI